MTNLETDTIYLKFQVLSKRFFFKLSLAIAVLPQTGQLIHYFSGQVIRHIHIIICYFEKESGCNGFSGYEIT